jgi:hypothetical protein
MDHSGTAVTFDFKIGKDGFGLGEIPVVIARGLEWSGNESDMAAAVQVDAPAQFWSGVSTGGT